MQNMPNWDDLRIFLALRRSGTLLGAGKLLGVNHTTVARRLAALESDLTARLFDRTPDGYVPTPMGETLAPFAESMEERYFALDRQVTGQDARLDGTVRIATSDTFASTFFVPRVLGALRERHPDIDLELVSTAAAYDLPRRQADLAIRMTRPSEQSLVVRKLAALAFGVYGARAYFARRGRPRAPDDLAGHTLVGYDREATPNIGARWLEQAARGLRVPVRGDHILTVRAAAVAGEGIAVIPCFLAAGVPELERVGAPISAHDVWLVQHADLQRTPRIRAVSEVIVERFARHARVLSGEDDGYAATSSPGAARGYSRPDPSTRRRARGRSRR
ncbi:MAG TPA: LysR family transcriptional regulator [Polyangia bacterium]|nr:LysR family transcriptional regulator [Polyangia bacterium]